ncbi:MAG: GNAT family N-acetyltransferase [Candidatus Hodarchaeota archaeon]
MVFLVVRASKSLMHEVRECINSNYDKYKDIVSEKDRSEHQVDEEWAERNFEIREFYLGRDSDKKKYVGMGSFQDLGKFAYVGYFYVKPEFQRQNYGRSIMNFLEMRAMSKNINDLMLFANNKADWAIKFYEKLGFEIISKDKEEILSIEKGVFKPFYEEDAYLMKKVLPEVKPLNISFN